MDVGAIEASKPEGAVLLGDLYPEELPGADAGTCYVCGRVTDRGWREAPSDNFTAWSQIYLGDVMCQRCRPLFKDRQIRMRSWILSASGGLELQTKDNPGMIWRYLVDPPDPPYAIYVTAGGQKQGWISLGRYVSTSRASYWIGTDWLDRPIRMSPAWVRERGELIARLRERKTLKQVLMDGQFSSGAYERAMREGWEADIEEVRALVGDPRWEVAVRAHT